MSTSGPTLTDPHKNTALFDADAGSASLMLDQRSSGWRGGTGISRFGRPCCWHQRNGVQNTVKGKSSPHACALVANMRHGSRESHDRRGHRNRRTHIFSFTSCCRSCRCLLRWFGLRLHPAASALVGSSRSRVFEWCLLYGHWSPLKQLASVLPISFHQ